MDFQDQFLDISVVTYNSSKWMERFIQSLLSQKLPLSQISLYFRDNGSTDPTVQTLNDIKAKFGSQFKSIEVAQGDNIGYGAGAIGRH